MADKRSSLSVASGNTALVARQPVFDLQDRIWGYELLFRDPSMLPGLGSNSSMTATSTVMIDGFALMRPFLRGNQRFLINFTADFLETELPAILPPEICTIEILETVEPTKKVLTGLENLKQQGYMLALDDYVGQEELKPFLPLVDIVKVDVLGQSDEQISQLTRRLLRLKVLLLAEKVEDVEMASFCREQGFSLFQGYFYSKAEIVKGAKLNPSQLTKARLLQLTTDKNTTMRKINEVISSDVFLTYRLLKYINSVYFGLPVKVLTVNHAIVLLGIRKVKQWLYVTAMAGLNTSTMSQELVYISAFRAKFLEMLARNNAASRRDKSLTSKLFLAGLFSLLENMMRVPLEDIFSAMSIDPEVLQVLDSGAGPLAPWFNLMVAYEHAQWDQVHKHAETLHIFDHEISAAYYEAGKWSAAVFAAPQ